MSNGKLLRQLIRSGAEGDLDAFHGVAKQVIADERQKQHHLLANDLESILYGHPQSPSSPALREPDRPPSPRTVSGASPC